MTMKHMRRHKTPEEKMAIARVKNEKVRKNKTELNKYKRELENKMLGVREYVNRILEILLTIKKKELYYYDHCQSMRAFVLKNCYHEKMSLNYSTVDTRIKAIEYAKSIGLKSKEYDNIGYTKLLLFKSKGITKAKDVLALSNTPINTIRYSISLERNPLTGRIMPKVTPKRRPNTVLRILDIEIPSKELSRWEGKLVRICDAHDVVIREKLAEEMRTGPGRRPRQFTTVVKGVEKIDLT